MEAKNLGNSLKLININNLECIVYILIFVLSINLKQNK